MLTIYQRHYSASPKLHFRAGDIKYKDSLNKYNKCRKWFLGLF
jgi:hypothetical protein